MKSPDRARRAAGAPSPPHRPAAQTGEYEGDIVDISDDIVEEEAVVEAAPESSDRTIRVEAPEVHAESRDHAVRTRERRSTVVSPIPAILAKSMSTVAEVPHTRDSAAPVLGHHDATVPAAARKKPESGPHYTVEVVREDDAASSGGVPQLIDRARGAFDRGDVETAAELAEQALAAVERSGVGKELVTPVRPLFESIFSSFVGPLGEIPVVAKPDDFIMAQKLTDGTRTLLRRIDGVRSLEQLLGHSSIAQQDALRIAASLLRLGIIRVV